MYAMREWQALPSAQTLVEHILTGDSDWRPLAGESDRLTGRAECFTWQGSTTHGFACRMGFQGAEMQGQGHASSR